MTGRPDGPFHPYGQVPDILQPRLAPTPHLARVVEEIFPLRSIRGMSAEGLTESPLILFLDGYKGSCDKITRLAMAAELDGVPTALEVGPGNQWSPLETANNLRIGPHDKHPLTIGVNLPYTHWPIIHPRQGSTIPPYNSESWAALFMVDVLKLASQPTPPQFDRVHFIAPVPSSYELIINCARLVRANTGTLVAVTDLLMSHERLEIVREELRAIGFESVELELFAQASRLPQLTGATCSEFLNSDEPVHTLVAANRVK